MERGNRRVAVETQWTTRDDTCAAARGSGASRRQRVVCIRRECTRGVERVRTRQLYYFLAKHETAETDSADAAAGQRQPQHFCRVHHAKHQRWPREIRTPGFDRRAAPTGVGVNQLVNKHSCSSLVCKFEHGRLSYTSNIIQ